MPTVATALATATAGLKGSDSARLDAELLLGQVLRKPRSWLYAWPEAQLSDVQALEFATMCARRSAGEPVAYLTGRKGFWTHELEVGPGVLIPRPETEVLVEQALACGEQLSGKVADLGTGSGAVALALRHCNEINVAIGLVGWRFLV